MQNVYSKDKPKDQQPGWFGKQLEENVKALREGDQSRIPWILCVFAEHHDQPKLTAAKVLREMLDNMSFDEIVRVDEQIRQTTSMEWSINWRELNINNFFTHQMDARDRRAIRSLFYERRFSENYAALDKTWTMRLAYFYATSTP